MRYLSLGIVLTLAPLLAQHGRDSLGNPYNAAADIEAGRLLYRANCAVCHGLDAKGGRGPDLSRGVFRRGSTDEALFAVIVKGIPGTEMPPIWMEGRLTWQLVAYLRSLPAKSGAGSGAGDAARGKALVNGKGGCLQCHRIDSQGSRMGPDLSGIGSALARAQLETALLRPAAQIKPEHWMVRAVTREGRAITGRRLNEDTFSIQLIDANERLVSLLKSELKQLTIDTGSAMPSFESKLTRQEIDDVTTYLATLR